MDDHPNSNFIQMDKQLCTNDSLSLVYTVNTIEL